MILGPSVNKQPDLPKAAATRFWQVCGKRERERKSASAPPSNCSANYYAKIAEILATHDELFWPTL